MSAGGGFGELLSLHAHQRPGAARLKRDGRLRWSVLLVFAVPLGVLEF